MYYCHSRYYYPDICRWISGDSEQYLDDSTFVGLNLFAYCRNDPINFFDYTGRWVDVVIDLVFLFIGIVDYLNDPTEEKAAWLCVDMLLTAIPAVPAVSGLRHFSKVDDVIDITKFFGKIDNVTDASHVINKVDDALEISSKRIDEITHTVYTSKQNGVVNYVGRTNNLNRRTYQHKLANRGIYPQRIASNLTIKQARGLEQVLIEYYKPTGKLLNKINSISKNNPIYDEATEWAKKYIKENIKDLF